jgi:hypothetical protein
MACRRLEAGAVWGCEGQGRGQERYGVLARGTARATLQVNDGTDAQASALRQFLLREPSRLSILP